MTIVPMRSPPSISTEMIPTMIGMSIGMSAGASISLIADVVTIPIAVE